MLYACLRSLKDGSAIKRMVDNTDNDLEKIGNLAYYLFNSSLENYYSGIKLRNGINGSTGTWKGASVSRFNTPETLAKLIWQSILAHTNTRD